MRRLRRSHPRRPQALYLLDRPERATRQTKGIILTEVVAPEALLYSQLHLVENLPWSFSFPDLAWLGVHLSGPDAGKEENMIDNSRREVRGDISVTELKSDGSVVVTFGGEVKTLPTGQSWIISGAKNESHLVIHSFGRWNTSNITYGETQIP